jgi:hypothetical protein
VAVAKKVVQFCQQDKKARFASRRLAEAAIRRMKAEGTTAELLALAPYRCITHHCYHVGRR